MRDQKKKQGGRKESKLARAQFSKRMKKGEEGEKGVCGKGGVNQGGGEGKLDEAFQSEGGSVFLIPGFRRGSKKTEENSRTGPRRKISVGKQGGKDRLYCSSDTVGLETNEKMAESKKKTRRRTGDRAGNRKTVEESKNFGGKKRKTWETALQGGKKRSIEDSGIMEKNKTTADAKERRRKGGKSLNS